MTALIHIIVLLVVFGLIAWLVLTYIPMPEPVKQVIIVIMVICLILFILQAFGIFGNLQLKG